MHTYQVQVVAAACLLVAVATIALGTHTSSPNPPYPEPMDAARVWRREHRLRYHSIHCPERFEEERSAPCLLLAPDGLGGMSEVLLRCNPYGCWK